MKLQRDFPNWLTLSNALSAGPCDYDDHSLFLNDARIESLKSIKILGVTLDKNLAYKEHISDKLKKAYARRPPR